MNDIQFLEVKDVLRINKKTMLQFGGTPGIRDRGLLESAVAQPSMEVFGHRLHNDIFDMASAYCFHIIKNHPFVDGNKRTGLLSALTFLAMNGIAINVSHNTLYYLALEVASSDLSKEDVAEFFRYANTRRKLLKR